MLPPTVGVDLATWRLCDDRCLRIQGDLGRPGVTAAGILDKLRALSEALNGHMDGPFAGDRDFRKRLADVPNNAIDLCQAAFLSDTIVVCVAYKSLRKLITQWNEAYPDSLQPVP